MSKDRGDHLRVLSRKSTIRKGVKAVQPLLRRNASLLAPGPRVLAHFLAASLLEAGFTVAFVNEVGASMSALQPKNRE
jgi:hypothetical protein